MDRLKLLIKGAIIGIAKIIPGVSGAILAILLGLYDKAIDALTNFFDNKRDNFYFLLYTGLGVLLALIFGSKVILYFLNRYEFVTLLFFIGLMVPSIKPLTKNIKKCFGDYILIVLGIVFTFLFMISFDSSINILGSNKFLNFIIIFVGGMVDAFASIFPGVSGTALLIFMGIYEVIINSLSSITNFSLIGSNLLVIVPFSMGMLFGFVLFAKLINYLFKHYKSETYAFIFGICILSLFFLIRIVFSLQYGYIELFVGLIFVLAGYFIARKL